MKKIFCICLIIFSLLCLLLTFLAGNILYNFNFFQCSHKEFSTVVEDASCTASGRVLRVCKKCSFQYASEIKEPTGHSFKQITSPPSCVTEGYTLNYCSCGYSFSSNHIAPLKHDLKCTTVAANCSEQGYNEYSCADCEYSFKSDFTAPLGHSFSKETHLPTATKAGYTKYSCDCSYSYIGDLVYYSDILENAYTENTQILAKGLDVSRWNHQIDAASGEYLPLDWNKIKQAGFDFVIIKAGSTKSGIEPTFESDYRGAKEAGLKVGVYFYTYSLTVDQISSDASRLLSWLDGKQLEYPVYLDLEDPSLQNLGKNHLGNMCVAFIEALQKQGYYAGLYTNHSWLTTILDTAKMVSLFDIWYARYPGTSVPAWNEEKYGKQLGMWQYTQSGVIDGIEGVFDFNYAYKDYEALMKRWELNGF